MADVFILGIESSCDETAAAVVRSGEHMESNVVLSQFAIHQRFRRSSPMLRPVPAAVLAAPRAQPAADVNGQPAHQPQPGGQDRGHEVRPVLHLRAHEDLLMSASRAMRLNSLDFHSRPRHPTGTARVATKRDIYNKTKNARQQILRLLSKKLHARGWRGFRGNRRGDRTRKERGFARYARWSSRLMVAAA